MTKPVRKSAQGTSKEREKIASACLDDAAKAESSKESNHLETLDALPALVFLEKAGKIVFANAEVRQWLGLGEEKWSERPTNEVLWGFFSGTAEPETRSVPFRATMHLGDGKLVPVEGACCIVNSDLRETVIIGHPVGRERAPKSRLMDDVLASIPEAVVIEHGNHILYTNPAFTRIFGYSAEEAGGGSLRQLIVPRTRLHEQETLEKTVDKQGHAALETVRMNQDGDLVDVSIQIGPLVVGGLRVGYLSTFRNIAERREVESKLAQDAMHDALTGLPNRALLLDRVSQALRRRGRSPWKGCGMLYLDLDHFKQINDTLGHAAGDLLLLSAAQRLRVVLRPQDSPARMGSDEFAILVDGIDTAAELEIVAGRVLAEMQRPFTLYEDTLQIGASIGVAMAGPEYTAGESLLRDAASAMQRARDAGGGRYEMHSGHTDPSATGPE
jgi:diguanylate cyclase (GGDEF)-like protein/PAS domain S-box-containing protein